MDLSIVIITWNAKEYLKNCIGSIRTHLGSVQPEIVVVDNGSRDGTAEWVSSKEPELVYIRNEKNLGVSRARNQGIRRSSGDFLLLLDVDTVLPDDSIRKMVDYVKIRPRVGLAGPKLTHPDGTLQWTCRRGHTLFIPVLRRLDFIPAVRKCRTLKQYQMEDYDHRSPLPVDHVIGACQLIPRRIIDRVGLLDESMFYGWEDTDYCVRVRRAGFEVHYYPDSRVIHHEQRLTKRRFLSRLTFESVKSMIRFFIKYPGGMWGDYRTDGANSAGPT